MSAIVRLHHKYSNLFLKVQKIELRALKEMALNGIRACAFNGIEWQRTPKECLISGALPFSECNERMPFVVIQRTK